MSEISFLVGLKNNIEYTKYFYKTTRRLYPKVEIVFVSFGSTDGTHEWLDTLEDNYLKYYFSDESKTLADTYNECLKIATKKFVCFLHNDMILGKYFLENLEKNISKNHLYYYTVIEPPIFSEDQRNWKIINDFGNDYIDFENEKFLDFEKNQIERLDDNILFTTEDVSFFLCISKQILLDIGGLDPLFSPMFREDDDLILRLFHLEMKFFVIKSALVYHFVSKTSRFSNEYKNKTQLIEINSERNFIRKWGFKSFQQKGSKYDIGIILNNANFSNLYKTEPYATIIYTDFPTSQYIYSEQKNTKLKLKEKIRSKSKYKNHDVLVYINSKHMNSKTEEILANLPQIIDEKTQNKYSKNLTLKVYGINYLDLLCQK